MVPDKLIFAGAGIRAALIVFATLQDFWAEIPYTDVDYRVFTEAAESVAMGVSPYAGRTPLLAAADTKYRYSPLLAYLCLPNVKLHPAWGKVVFASMDIMAAKVLLAYLRSVAASEALTRTAIGFWLLNPFIFTISTRGSCEPVQVLLLYSMLYLRERQCLNSAAAVFGLAVHFRIYPVIYGPSLIFSLCDPLHVGNCQQLLRRRVWSFFLVSAGVFLSLLMLFHAIYGSDFVEASYLYHAGRVDTHHSFSVYFYPLRQFPGLARVALLFQLGVCGMLSLLVAQGRLRLVPCMLLQSLAFVALSPVITAQYFVWWLAMLPPALVDLEQVPISESIIIDRGIAQALGAWALSEVHWLLWAYCLEFRKLPVAAGVWVASCIFLIAEARVAWAVWCCTAAKGKRP